VLGNLGAAHILVPLFAALLILGPERLPAAATSVAKALRQVQQSATSARAQLTDELGPELDDLRKPLAGLHKRRGMTATSLITQHRCDGDASTFTFSDPDPAPVSGAPVSMAKGTSSTPSPCSPHWL
jgi:sec-independent protein translocase protein TatB